MKSDYSISSYVHKALAQNRIIHSYMIAVIHALLWIAALSFAAFFHLSPAFSKAQALLGSTLVAYGAYICESVLSTLNAASGLSLYHLDFRKAGLWKWIALNILTCGILSVFFLSTPSWLFLLAVILTAGWQKYMDGRVAPRLKSTARKISINLD